MRTVEFRERRPDDPFELRGLGPEVQPGEVWVSCRVCGYYGLVPRSVATIEGVRCEECNEDDEGDSGQSLPEGYESPECNPASLRDGETVDETSHARGNLRQIKKGVEDGVMDLSEVSEENREAVADLLNEDEADEEGGDYA